MTNIPKEMTTNYLDFEVERLDFEKFDDSANNTRSKGQRISFPRYTHPKYGSDFTLFIQFPWVHMSSYGIPRKGEYYLEDYQRTFIKLPLDQSIDEIREFSNRIKLVDQKLGSNEFKVKMFGEKAAAKYNYQPIFRLPQDEDDEDNDANNNKKNIKKDYGPRHPYMKLKIDTNYEDGKIKTRVFNSVLDESEKRVRTKVDNIETLDDMASHVCYLSKIRPIARPIKLWAQPTKNKDPTYGLTFKIMKVEVEPPAKKNSNIKQYLESDDFLDSDNESDNIETVETVSKNATKPVVKQIAEVESDDENVAESENESESDDDEVVTVKAPAKQVVHVESEDDSDEEVVKPVKKSVAKTAPKTNTRSSKKSVN